MFKLKKIISVCLITALMLCSVVTVNGATGGVKIVVDGKPLSTEGVIVNGRTLAPVRAIAEAMGATVEWNQQEKRIILSKIYWDSMGVKPEPDVRKVYMWIGKNKGTVNTLEFEMDVPPQIISGNTMIPVKAFSSTLEATVAWNQQTKTVAITSNLASTGGEAKYDALKQTVDERNTTANYLKEVNKGIEEALKQEAEDEEKWREKVLQGDYYWDTGLDIDTKGPNLKYSGVIVYIRNKAEDVASAMPVYFVIKESNAWASEIIYQQEFEIPQLKGDTDIYIKLDIPKEYLNHSYDSKFWIVKEL